MTALGTVFLTGGTGSFGRSFIRHVLTHDLVDRVVSVSRNAEMRYRLEQEVPDPRLVVVPGDVRILDDLKACYAGPVDVIIHAAAEKHIGTGERHEQYVRSINYDGAQNLIRFAINREVARVVALSTDKACRPVNAYGRSKAAAEQAFVMANQWVVPTKSRFAVVRYGNVVGSSGSVLPLFIRQRATGRLTITDRRMTRFFMPLSDTSDFQVFQEPGRRPVRSAVSLVLYALMAMSGGEVFVPKIPSGTIEDLAKQVGPHQVGPHCRIEEIGIRPGEKLHEDLIAPEESAWCRYFGGDEVFVLTPGHIRETLGQPKVPHGFSYTSADHPLPLRLEMTEALA